MTQMMSPKTESRSPFHEEVLAEDVTMTIPAMHRVGACVLDAPKPHLALYRADVAHTQRTLRVDIPSPLAYYLTVHSMGSERMRESVSQKMRKEIAQGWMEKYPELKKMVGAGDRPQFVDDCPVRTPHKRAPYVTVDESLTIEKGWVVVECALDQAEPTIKVMQRSAGMGSIFDELPEKTLRVPMALAYHLAVVDCGRTTSLEPLRKELEKQMRRELRQLLGMKID